MTRRVRDVMTLHPHALRADATLREAAKEMREADITSIVVVKDGAICGIVTDRDIVLRAVAQGKGPETPLADVCTRFIVTLSPDTEIDEAVRLMRDRAVRRLPVEEDGHPVGIVSLIDLALDQQDYSILSQLHEQPVTR